MKKVIYAGASWCPSCVVFHPQVEAECKRKGLEFQYVDVEENEELAVKYGIRNVPTVMILDKDGNAVERGTAADILPKIREYKNV